LEAAIRERVREVIEKILHEEVEEALGAGRGQRAVGRRGYRHGTKARGLALRSGAVKLAIPRARLVNSDGDEREWRSVLLPRYRRSSPEVEQAVLGVYLSGGNTRRIRGALKPLLSGAPLSKSAVSRLVNRLEESYERWRQRDLAEDHIVYLYLDAIYPKVRSALERIWPGVAHQRCTVHKLRNLLAKAPEHAQEAVHEDYNRIVYAPDRAAAEKARDSFLTKWRKPCPSVTGSLEEAGEELLTFYGFPASQHKSLRTTNAIERLQEEFRRRIKTQASLPAEKQHAEGREQARDYHRGQRDRVHACLDQKQQRRNSTHDLDES
jgi:transposase-like protein